jgi:hypothetical protein
LIKHGTLYGSVVLVRESLRMVNPILLLLALPALVSLPNKLRALLIGTLGLTISLAVLGPVFKAQLELQRLWLLVVTLLIPPVAGKVVSVLSSKGELLPKLLRIPSQVVVLSLLLLPAPWLWGVVTNRTTEKFHFSSPVVEELAHAITQHAGEGRAIFPGFILHELCEGHIAPLPLLTKVPLVASSYQHDRWKYTELIPEEFLKKGKEGLAQYLQVMNGSLLVVHEPNWKKWFRAHARGYAEVAKVGRFVLFKPNHIEPSYIFEGEGELISQDGSSIRVRPLSEKLTIKFNYLPLLETSGCSISPAKVSKSVTLISLQDCKVGDVVTISMKAPTARLLSLIH